MSAFSDLIATAALALSGYATWRAHRVTAKQERVLELEEKVHALTLDREARIAADAGEADVSCALVKLGSTKYRLKVFNRGKAAAGNVTIEFPHGNALVHESDLQRQFPMRMIEPGQSVELMAVVHMQTPKKHVVKLSWDNLNGDRRDKELEVTL